MSSQLRCFVLSAAIAATPAPVFTATSVFASTIHQSQASVTLLSKQSSSPTSLCQSELRNRMGGDRAQVGISSVSEPLVSGTLIRLTGTGTYTRSSSSSSSSSSGSSEDEQNFNFSCVIDTHENRVLSLSYTFTGSTVFGGGSSW